MERKDVVLLGLVHQNVCITIIERPNELGDFRKKGAVSRFSLSPRIVLRNTIETYLRGS